MVDFTRPDVVMDSLRIITSHGVNAVVGTTGFSPEDLEEVKGLAEKMVSASSFVQTLPLVPF